MLSKKKRVTKDIFQNVLIKGNIISSSFFLFRYLKQNTPQYAFVVSKKLVKTATKRNFLRRIGYNILREYDPKTGIGLFFYKKEGLIASKDLIKKDIENILKKANFI